MKSINEVLEEAPVTNYSGSEKTFEAVASEIEKRFGSKAKKNYDAFRNCRTYASWLKLGFCPKRGSRSIKSVVYLEKKDAEGNVIEKIPRKIHLFFMDQVEKIET